MLRGVIICTDKDLSVELQDALAETHRIGIMRSLDHYPNEVDLTRFLRKTGPNVVFLSVETVKTALELAARIEGQAPGTQIVVFNRACQPDALLETMRAGIREFLSPLSSRRPCSRHWKGWSRLWSVNRRQSSQLMR